VVYSDSANLAAGTIIGSGTVSNETFREIGSTCISERRGIEMMNNGEVKTPYMSFGDRVRMECKTRDGQPLFGVIDQVVVKADA
jgi:fumarylacetoacetate (FAA) hydrolase